MSGQHGSGLLTGVDSRLWRHLCRPGLERCRVLPVDLLVLGAGWNQLLRLPLVLLRTLPVHLLLLLLDCRSGWRLLDHHSPH